MDTARDFSEALPMLHTLRKHEKPLLIQYAEMLKAHDEQMVESFADMLSRKIARYNNLLETDRFDMSKEDADKIQRQLRFLADEISVLTYLSKLMIRHFEKWFSPEMHRFTQLYVESRKRWLEEVEFWKGLYFTHSEYSDYFTALALKKTTELVETKEKLNRYQELFIKNNIIL